MNKKAILILVCGGSGSGKTTLSNEIKKLLPSNITSQILCQDQWYKKRRYYGKDLYNKCNFDHPKAFDFNLLYRNLDDLINYRQTNLPMYDYVKSQRLKEVTIAKPTDVIILEGILVLYDKRIRELADIKVYVDTPEDERFIRRLIRDKKERGRSDENIIAQWRNVVRPMYKSFVSPQKSDADIIVPWYRINNKAIMAINGAIKGIIEDKRN